MAALAVIFPSMVSTISYEKVSVMVFSWYSMVSSRNFDWLVTSSPTFYHSSVMVVIVSRRLSQQLSLSGYWLFIPKRAKGSMYLSRLARECFRWPSRTQKWQMSLLALQFSSRHRYLMGWLLCSGLLQEVLGWLDIKFILVWDIAG